MASVGGEAAAGTAAAAETQAVPQEGAQEGSVLDTVYNWIVDAPAEGQAPAEGEEAGGPTYLESISTNLEGVTTSVVSYFAPAEGTEAAAAAGTVEGGAEAGGEKQEEGEAEPGALEQVTKQAADATAVVTESISSFYYGQPVQEESGEASEGEVKYAGGFKDTLDSQYNYVASYFVPPEGAEEGEAGAPPPGSEKPYLADWFLPQPPADGEAAAEGEQPPPPEKVDIDGAVGDFFSYTATSLQRLVDRGPPPPERSKAPAAADGGAGPSEPPPVNRTSGSKPGGGPPPRPVSSKAAVFGSTVGGRGAARGRGGVSPRGRGAAPPPRPSAAGKGAVA